MKESNRSWVAIWSSLAGFAVGVVVAKATVARKPEKGHEADSLHSTLEECEQALSTLDKRLKTNVG